MICDLLWLLNAAFRHGVHKGRNAEILEDRLTVKRVNGSPLAAGLVSNVLISLAFRDNMQSWLLKTLLDIFWMIAATTHHHLSYSFLCLWLWFVLLILLFYCSPMQLYTFLPILQLSLKKLLTSDSFSYHCYLHHFACIPVSRPASFNDLVVTKCTCVTIPGHPLICIQQGKGLELPEGHAIVVSSGVAREFRCTHLRRWSENKPLHFSSTCHHIWYGSCVQPSWWCAHVLVDSMHAVHDVKCSAGLALSFYGTLGALTSLVPKINYWYSIMT